MSGFCRLALTLLLAMLLTPIGVSAQDNKFQMDVELGYGDTPLRVGRWVPLFITLADPAATPSRPRGVRIEVEASQGGSSIMQVSQVATVGPIPATFSLLIPFRFEYRDGGVGVTVRDDTTQKTLARWPAGERSVDPSDSLWQRLRETDSRLVGVIGERTLLETFQRETDRKMQVAYIPPDRLAVQSQAYDLLDLLVLNRPNVNRLSQDQQQAIVEWVRAGGTLLMWPGDDPVPAGPLADMLPCRIGAPKSYPFTPEQRKRWTLHEQYTGLNGNLLEPRPGAEPLPILPDKSNHAVAQAYTHRVGFGRVTVLPFDISRLQFDNDYEAKQCFQMFLGRLGLYEEVPSYSGGGYYSYGSENHSRRQDGATEALQDYIGAVPGAGRFGFSYVVWVVLGMMVLVGPVDWFVLKKLGRQPWTWVTTAGWIGLITVGALSIAKVFKSGDLHFRTVELVDQADDKVIGRVTLAGIFSPRTADYRLEAPANAGAPAGGEPAGWWSVASLGGRSMGMQLDSPFHQTTTGNAPSTTTINVWNLRFFRGETSTVEAPLIKADLKAVRQSGKDMEIEGTITNLSNVPMLDVRLQVGQSFADAGISPPVPATPKVLDSEEPVESTNGIDVSGSGDQMSQVRLERSPLVVRRLDPGQSHLVKAKLVGQMISTKSSANARYYGYRDTAPPPPQETIWSHAIDLASRRSWRSQIEAEDVSTGVIYARMADVVPSVTLPEPAALQRHDRVLRAIVKVGSK